MTDKRGNSVKTMVRLISLVLLIGLSQVSIGQSSDLVRAKHLIGQVERGLARVQRNDLNSINGYTDKLKQAKDILEAEADKQDPEFRAAAQQWMAARERLYATMESWKSKPASNQPPVSTTSSPSNIPSGELYTQLIAKYQSQNRPRLTPEADLPTASAWSEQMLNLYMGAWQQDNLKAKQWYQAGQLSKQDYDRFVRWVNGTWRQQIGDQINQSYGIWDRTLAQNLVQAQRLIAIKDDDQNKVMNSAGGVHLARNQEMLAQSRDLLVLVKKIESAFEKSQPELRQQQANVLAQAEQHLQQLVPLASQYLAKWKQLPKKSNKNPNSQYLWLKGSRFAEITQKGEVWINSNFVGSIGSNGEIYARGNYVGKIQPDGELWLSKQNRSAKMMSNGEVWLGGSHVGTIHPSGEVSGLGTAASVEGPGDWRRAAVVYFLNAFPQQ